MKHIPRQLLDQPWHVIWVPTLVLIVALIITISATALTDQVSRGRNELRFLNDSEELRGQIEKQVGVYLALLQGVAGLIAVEDDVSPEAFNRYVEKLNLALNYPGVRGVGISARLALAERDDFLARMRGFGRTDFRIWPEGERDEYHIVALLEPLDERNRLVLGYDMSTEATRRAAIERARDSGAPAASGAVVLVQDTQTTQKQSGFLLYMPIYSGNVVPSTVVERRARLRGFAYSSFRTNDLFASIFGVARAGKIAVDIYDGSSVRPDALLYSSPRTTAATYKPQFTRREILPVAGRTWTIVYQTQPNFDQTGAPSLAPLTLIMGLVLSLVLFFVVRSQTIARHQAELAVQARDTFLSVASHELKTPLTALLGNAQLLLRRADRSGLDARSRHNAQRIVDQSQRLVKLIDDLLDHTRLQAGRMQLQLHMFDLSGLLRRVAGEIRPTLSGHNLLVQAPDSPLPICGDELRVEQVLLNLLGNAIKYSPDGGQIDVQLTAEEGWAILKVSDTGIGIPQAALSELFTQFYRAPNAVSRQIGGMGIGLYVVHEIIQRHGGTINVHSSESQGSTFTVHLPLEQPKPTPGVDHR